MLDFSFQTETSKLTRKYPQKSFQVSSQYKKLNVLFRTKHSGVKSAPVLKANPQHKTQSQRLKKSWPNTVSCTWQEVKVISISAYSLEAWLLVSRSYLIVCIFVQGLVVKVNSSGYHLDFIPVTSWCIQHESYVLSSSYVAPANTNLSQ